MKTRLFRAFPLALNAGGGSASQTAATPPLRAARRVPRPAYEGVRPSPAGTSRRDEPKETNPAPSGRYGEPSVLARIAALGSAPIAALKQQWRDLFETEPPPYNRRFLEHRLAYRIQELAYGGLKPETLKRLRELAEELDGGDPKRRRLPAKDRPISGTRLIREYQGIEHCVTVRDNGYEYQGRPYKSLSAIARAITGTRWNGLVFFGLKNRVSR